MPRSGNAEEVVGGHAGDTAVMRTPTVADHHDGDPDLLHTSKRSEAPPSKQNVLAPNNRMIWLNAESPGRC